MKLIAIYSVWDGEELLEGSIRQIRPYVDHVLCLTQSVSNWGEKYDGGVKECKRLKDLNLVDEIQEYKPFGPNGIQNETIKRNQGLFYTKQRDFTHFIHLDCDEYYKPSEFAAAKRLIEKKDYTSTVVKIKTYWKNPEWVFDSFDGYYVPFICKFWPGVKCGNFPEFPFYCDPTRKINTKDSFLLPENKIYMHHYSWVRKDIERKARNSSAKYNLKRTSALTDYYKSNLGDFVNYYQKKLIFTENIFNIKPFGSGSDVEWHVTKQVGS